MKGAQRSLDPASAEALRERMSEISEKHWCAGWMQDLEFSLWDILQHGGLEFGNGKVALEDLAELQKLSDWCGGWCRWTDEDDDAVFVPLAEWKDLVRARHAAR
jgi:hypothetical protein